jgi:hypothetical protein
MTKNKLNRRHFLLVFSGLSIFQQGFPKLTMANNNNLSPTIFQHWTHSGEEDVGDIYVYRTNDYQFPPSRGRDGFEIKASGEFILYGPGPTDRPQQIVGGWTMEDPDRIKVRVSIWGTNERIIEFVFCDEKLLKLRYLN